jgi:hypothetical protein
VTIKEGQGIHASSLPRLEAKAKPTQQTSL